MHNISSELKYKISFKYELSDYFSFIVISTILFKEPRTRIRRNEKTEKFNVKMIYHKTYFNGKNTKE